MFFFIAYPQNNRFPQETLVLKGQNCDIFPQLLYFERPCLVSNVEKPPRHSCKQLTLKVDTKFISNIV